MADSRLTRTISSAGSLTTWTFSTWIKRSLLTDDTIMAQGSSGDNFMEIHFDGNDCLDWRQYVSGAYQGRLQTNRRFRDTNGWYHIVCQWDTTNGTAGDRMKMWVNGVQETSFQATTNPTSSRSSVWNSTSGTMNIGSAWNAAYYFNGCQSHTAFVNGAIVAPTVFGSTDSTSGIWKFKSPSGVTWGTNGFHLKYENSGNLGLDSSGQSSTFTVSGDLKQSIDTPSNVYATMNAAFNLSDIQLTEAAMRVKNTNSNWKYVNSTLAANKGKWYCEQKININGGYVMLGVTDMRYATSQDANSYTHSGAGTGSASIYHANGYKYLQGSDSTYAGSYTTGDIIGCALDMDNDKVYFSKNGAWATGSGAWGSTTFDAAVGAITLPTTNATYSFATSVRSSAITQTNFGTGQFGATTITSAGSNGNGSLFEYDVPSGYYALNTKNINTYG
jgi:hypothetical protein